MTVTAHTAENGNAMTIEISERFDFNVHKELRAAYESCGRPCQSYVVDLRGTSYMDSSALGMLLQLREYAGGNKNAITIRNADKSIKEILRIANFDKLMNVE